jgi:Xaa-Pro aminopeptidase
VSVDHIPDKGGYPAEVGRTVFVGAPPPGAAEALAACRRAVDAGVAALRPGVAARDVDAAARQVMDAAGLGDAFVIPAGHGIGLELHEPPRLGPESTAAVPEGCVVTVEVSAWRAGTLSAFWEEDAVVTPGGARLLTRGPDAPLVVA